MPAHREIGPVGTAARVVIGLVLLAFGLVGGKVIAVHGQFSTGFTPLSVGVGLVVMPAAALAWHLLWSRRSKRRFQATGPRATGINLLAGLVLYLTPWYAPPIAFTSSAVLIFYGASMLLAAVRGYAGCEILVVSNWLLRRDDQVGCVLLSPIDAAEGQLHRPAGRA